MSDLVERLSDEELTKLIEQARAHAITGTLMDDPLLSALSDLARLRALTEWRDIETAPRDGTHVLLYAPAWPAPNTGWTFGTGDWQDCPYHHGGDPEWKPAHWLPLSPPPVKKG